MFNLPKSSAKVNQKISTRSFAFDHTQNRKKTNINQIKEEIEYILKRNHSPSSLNTQKQLQKSNKNIHHHLLQRKRSKIIQRANQQNIEKVKNNRKLYEQYLMGDLAPKTYSKTIQSKDSTHHFNLNQTIFSKELQKDLSSSRNRFNSSRTLELLRKQKKSQSMFTDKEIQHLGLGKLLFYKDSNIKLKRSSLLQGRQSTDQRNLFRDTAMQSFYQDHSLDITRYLKPQIKKNIEEKQEPQIKKPEPKLQRQPSLEIFKKDIIPKESFPHQASSLANPENLSILGKKKFYVQNSHIQIQPKALTKYDISPHLRNKEKEMRQTLNVMDQQLLVYYGKMKGKKSSKDFLPSVTLRTNAMHKQTFKQRPKQNQQKISSLFQIGNRTSIGINKPIQRQESWRFQRFDPWQKHKHQEQIENENVFGQTQQGSITLSQYQKNEM